MKTVDELRFKIIDMNKTILAIETSSSMCSVSLFKNGENIGILENDTDRKHAEVLPSYVVSLLENNQLKIKNIDVINPDNPKKIISRIKRRFSRLHPDEMETSFMRGFLAAINKKLK